MKIQTLISKRQHAFRLDHNHLWRHYKNAVNNAIINAKKYFTSDKLSQANPNFCSWYATGKQLSGVRPKKKVIAEPSFRDLSIQRGARYANRPALLPHLQLAACSGPHGSTNLPTGKQNLLRQL